MIFPGWSWWWGSLRGRLGCCRGHLWTSGCWGEWHSLSAQLHIFLDWITENIELYHKLNCVIILPLFILQQFLFVFISRYKSRNVLHGNEPPMRKIIRGIYLLRNQAIWICSNQYNLHVLFCVTLMWKTLSNPFFTHQVTTVVNCTTDLGCPHTGRWHRPNIICSSLWYCFDDGNMLWILQTEILDLWHLLVEASHKQLFDKHPKIHHAGYIHCWGDH